MDEPLTLHSSVHFFIDHESDLSLCQQLFDKHGTPQSRTSALLDQCTCLTSYVHKLRLATFHLLRNARAGISNAWQRCTQPAPWEVQTDAPPLLFPPRFRLMKSCTLWHDHLPLLPACQAQLMDHIHPPATPIFDHHLGYFCVQTLLSL